MGYLEILIFLIWLVVGVLDLRKDRISKASYGVMWLMLMLELFGDILGV